jgi:hypothetical protein
MSQKNEPTNPARLQPFGQGFCDMSPALTFFLKKVRCVLAFFKPESCRNCNPFINIPSNADLDVSIGRLWCTAFLKLYRRDNSQGCVALVVSVQFYFISGHQDCRRIMTYCAFNFDHKLNIKFESAHSVVIAHALRHRLSQDFVLRARICFL